MQYQINPVNPKRRSKRDIYPEKHYLELQKNTSYFKSEWTNTINVLNFQEVHLELNENPLESESREPLFKNLKEPNLDFPKTNLMDFQIDFPKPVNVEEYKPKPKKEKNNINQIYQQKAVIIYSKFLNPILNLNLNLNLIIPNENQNPTIPIPKNVFMCWSTLDIPLKMKEVIQINHQLNPEFTFYLYDDKMCREFIRDHFDIEVVYAFDTLIPGAYKADLWRLCVLFICGGIYLDIKYKCVNGFTFANVIDKEYLTLDLPSNQWINNMHGIYNGFMVCRPYTSFLWKCICGIVYNVKHKEYGKSCLFPTGPGLLGDIYFAEIIEKTEFLHKITTDFECVFSTNLKNIVFRNTAILEIYPEYRKDQQQETKVYYSLLWNRRRIYDENIHINFNNNPIIDIIDVKSNSIIPLKIYQTWYTKNIDLDGILQKNINILKTQNPEFEFYLFDDIDCRNFIETYFDITVVNAFDTLIPGAYKADLFRYCILYIQGGIYLDIKYYGINGFKFITLTDKEYFVRDISISGKGIYNALMICKAGNQFLWKAIQNIVENVSTLFYGINPLEPTGPLLLKKLIDKEDFELTHKELYCSKYVNYTINSDYELKYFIYYTGIPILTFSKEYRELQKQLSKKTYSLLWEDRNIYLI